VLDDSDVAVTVLAEARVDQVKLDRCSNLSDSARPGGFRENGAAAAITWMSVTNASASWTAKAGSNIAPGQSAICHKGWPNRSVCTGQAAS
jgi:hypothetical protein